ncbi:VIT1/CCC1 transporter family protein [Candidatus Peregrinibacteria bacterium]|nr:VIT1/CCC1 transporter family protein [Candidatus Peregrinibacteria bacterium]
MEDHPPSNISKQKGHYSWVSDFVYGGIDGAVTTFAVVAGVEGASLPISIVLIMGFANLFADGFSMATGKYLSDKSKKEQFEKIHQIEMQHIKEKPKLEKEEIREILQHYGFGGNDLVRATDIITSNDEHWVDLMMRNEFHLTQENIYPIKGALTTIISFMLIGFIPLIAYTFRPFLQLDNTTAFRLTALSTLFALFIVGAVKGRFTSKYWLYSGLETSFIGGLAAFIAYIVGFFLKQI